LVYVLRQIQIGEGKVFTSGAICGRGIATAACAAFPVHASAQSYTGKGLPRLVLMGRRCYGLAA
jgi:hypothetical protein